MSIARSMRDPARRDYLFDVEMIRRHWSDVAVMALAGWVLVSLVLAGDTRVRTGLTVMTLALVVLLGRRRFGLVAVVLSFALMAVAMHLVPSAPASMFLATLAGFGVAGALPTRRDAAVGCAVGAAVVLVTMLNSPATDGMSDIALTLAFCTIVWTAALLATDRGRQAESARLRTALVESTRNLDIAAATAHERARIAGELHDIVSHGLSIVVLQTVAARNTLTDEAVAHDPAVDRRLEAVESTAREALDDMRRLLDLLRLDDQPNAVLAPRVGVDQVLELVERTRVAGQPIRASIDLAGLELPAGLDATAYRIVQEAVTNALKHAPGASTSVGIIRSPDALSITVRTGPAIQQTDQGHGAGYGLVGMRERVRLYDGSLTADLEGEEFVVRAVLPVPNSVAGQRV